MISDVDSKTQARRLLILQLIHKDPDFSLNDDLLQRLLREAHHGVSMSVLRADLSELEALGLLATTDLPGCTVAILCRPGVDVATGVSVIAGIARATRI